MSNLNRSLLYEREAGMNALFDVSNGWEMARVFTDLTQEHRAVRESAGLLDLTSLGAIRVGGGEAIQFLNGLVTNDVKTLEAGHWMRAAFLTGHGKVRALCLILNLGGSYLILNDAQTHKKVYDYVFPFSYAGDFAVENASDQYRVLSVQGPKAHLVLKEVCFEPLASMQAHSWTEATVAGVRVTVLTHSRTGETGYDLLIPTEKLVDVWDFLLLKGAFHSLAPVGFEALDCLRLEAGVPVYGVDVDESNMFLETGLDDAVSFSKGCYTGQEAVAMATYRGHVSKKRAGLVFSGDTVPSAGDRVLKDEREIGSVTSACRSLSIGRIIALAYLKFGQLDPDQEVHIVNAGEQLEAKTVSLPFYSQM